MPDAYNPAVAAGIKPPENDFASTFGRIANIQAEQARTNLYTLQGLQQQRQYNGLMAAAEAFRTGQDPVAAAAPYGLDPAMLNQFQSLQENRRAYGTNPLGVSPEHYNQTLQAPGLAAGSQEAQTKADAEVAKTYGPGVLLNPNDDGAWRQLVLAHARALQGTPNQMNPVEIQAALNIKDPNMRTQGAIRYGTAAGVPLDKMTEAFGPGGAAAGDTGIDDYNNKNLTPAQRAGAAPILRQPGEVAQSKARAEKQGAYYGNLSSGIAAAGDTAANAQDEVRIAKSLINDPGFYSGSGEAVNLAYKRVLAAFNIDPGASLPQEAFRKVMAQNVLNQVQGLREAQSEIGGAGSRIFQSQIELMEKAAQNPDNSIAANRFLTTLAERSAARAQNIANMAANYKGGKLDPGFEKQLRDYTNKNPLFSDTELAYPKLIGESPRVAQHLKEHPETAAQFDAYYGKGASKAILGQ